MPIDPPEYCEHCGYIIKDVWAEVETSTKSITLCALCMTLTKGKRDMFIRTRDGQIINVSKEHISDTRDSKHNA